MQPQQIQNAEAAGLNVAVYHYAGFANPAQATQEADYLAGVLQKVKCSKGHGRCLRLGIRLH